VEPIIGIDLGTTNSLVAICDQTGTPQIIPDAQGRALLPSAVRYGPETSPSATAPLSALKQNPKPPTSPAKPSRA